MIQTLPRPARSAARAHSVQRAGAWAPIKATPRLSAQLEPIAFLEHREDTVPMIGRWRDLGHPCPTRARILEAARRQDDHDQLFRIDGAARVKLQDGRQRRRRRRLDEDALLTRQRALCFEHALVGDPYASAA